MYEAADEEEEDEEEEEDDDETTEAFSSPSTPTVKIAIAKQSKSNSSLRVALEGETRLEGEEEEEVIEEEGPSADVLSKMNKRNGRAEKRYHTAPVESKRGKPRDNSIHKRYSWHVGQQQQQQSHRQPQQHHNVCCCELSQQQQLNQNVAGSACPNCGGIGSMSVSNAVSNTSIVSSSGVSSSCSHLISYESSDYAESIPEVDSDSGALEEEEEEEEQFEGSYYGHHASGNLRLGGKGDKIQKRPSIALSTRSSSQDSEPESLEGRRLNSGKSKSRNVSGSGLQVDSDATSSSSATPTPTDVDSVNSMTILASSSNDQEESLTTSSGNSTLRPDVGSTPMPEIGKSSRRKMTPAERLRVKKLVLLNPTLEAS